MSQSSSSPDNSPISTPPSEPADVFAGLASIATDHPKNTERRLSAGDLQRALKVPELLKSSENATAAATFDVRVTGPERTQAEALDGTVDSGALTPPRRQSATLSAGVADALEHLGMRAAALGARDVSVDADSCVISFTLPSAPNERHEIAFKLEERTSESSAPKSKFLAVPTFFGLLAPAPKTKFLSLRVVPRYGTDVHCALAKEALGVLQGAVEGAYPTKPGSPKRVALFDADATRHLDKDELISIFKSPGYEQSWTDAKYTSRRDCTRTPEIDKLEEKISAQCGAPFRIPAREIGKAKMWCINDLRRVHYYEPLLERASHAFAAALNARINETENANRRHVKSCEQVGHGAYRIVLAPMIPSSEEDEIVVDLRYRAPGSRKATSDIDCSVCIRPDHLVDDTMLRVIKGYGTQPGLEAQLKQELGLDGADFDVNIYPQGFMRDISLPSLASPFHVRTSLGLGVKQMMNLGAAMKNLFSRKPDAVEACFKIFGSTKSLRSVDYALLREVNNGADLVRRTRDILLSHERVLTPAWQPLHDLPLAPLFLGSATIWTNWNSWDPAELQQARRLLTALREGGPLQVLRRGPLSDDERELVMRLASSLRVFREGLDEVELSIHNMPLGERARTDLVIDYEGELACVNKARDKVLLEILAYEKTDGSDDESGHDERFDHAKAWADFEYYSLLAMDLQVASNSEANDACSSASSMNKIVSGVQQQNPQIPDVSEDAVAALEEAQMVPSVDEYLRKQHVVPTKATKEQRERATTGKVFDVAKHLIRQITLAVAAMEADKRKSLSNVPRFPTARGLRSTADLVPLHLALEKAISDEKEDAATHALEEFGLRTDRDIAEFMTYLGLHCQPSSADAEAIVARAKAVRMLAMRELKSLSDKAKPGDP